MLTPEELRIGNIVSVTGKYQRIEEIHTDCIKLSGDIVCMPETVKPVELNEAVFKACGFEETHIRIYGYPLKRHFPFLLHKRQEKQGYDLLFDFKIVNEKKIQYLHELQNLYLDVSGKELPVNLPV